MGGLVMAKKFSSDYNLPEVTVTAINPNRGNKALHDYIMGVNSMRNDIMRERGISDSQWADLSK